MTQEEQVLIELLNCNAISENTGLTASEVSELVTHNKANARLSSLRQKGYVKSSNNSRPISVYWLSKEGIELASEIKTKQDQSTDANLSTADNTSENSELADVDDTNVADSQTIPEGFTPWAGGFRPVDVLETVYVVYRNGHKTGPHPAVSYNWHHSNTSFDIIAYRLSKQQTPEPMAVPESGNPYNPDYEMMGCALIDDVVANNVEAFNRLDDVAEKREIPPPQYNPDDVAFKKADINESWYMVDGINAQFETSPDAIAAAHDYVATHSMSTTVHIVASRKFAIIKPVVTTELEYL